MRTARQPMDKEGFRQPSAEAGGCRRTMRCSTCRAWAHLGGERLTARQDTELLAFGGEAGVREAAIGRGG